MKTGYRKARSIMLLLSGLLALVLNHTMDGFAVVLGMALLISSAFTLVYIFLHFDQNINQKTFMEMIFDGFAGLVIFTYPMSDQNFMLIVFSFWIVMMGVLYLAGGLMEESNKSYLWTYTLIGIVLIVLGFAIMHYESEYLDSVLYLIGFTMILYAGSSLYFMIKRKQELY